MRFWNRLIGFLLIAAVFSVPFVGMSQPTDLGGYKPPQEKIKLPFQWGKKPENVILMIGDGMPLTTISAARLRAVGSTGWLHVDRMPIAGFVRTCSADKLITDSAAAATAMAAGQKTDNGVIGQTPDGKSWESILEAFQKREIGCGLVVLSPISHATPGPFYAHTASRKDQPVIAEQLVNKALKINVLLGGGAAFFQPQSVQGSKRTDERDLIAEARRKGYEFVDNSETMLRSNARYLLGLFAPEGMTTKPPEPTLAEMTGKALQLLASEKKGFFLLVEGSQIDGANSRNDMEDAIRQTLNFDLAVQQVLDFATGNGRTLVVVTSDHENGGMAIVDGSLDGSDLQVAWAKKGHTGGTVPLYAFGPGAEKFSGFQENTDIPKAFASLMDIRDFPAALNP